MYRRVVDEVGTAGEACNMKLANGERSLIRGSNWNRKEEQEYHPSFQQVF